jgi:hypothetical protein
VGSSSAASARGQGEEYVEVAHVVGDQEYAATTPYSFTPKALPRLLT